MVNPAVKYVGDKRIRELLTAYQCPTPFPAVRTMFLGNIASPRFDALPVQAIKALWGGELPEFESEDAASGLVGDLMSLWNQLTVHQSRNRPFRLVRQTLVPTSESLANVSQLRVEELDGFVAGLFDQEECLDLTEAAAEAMDELAGGRALFISAINLLRETKTDPNHREIKETIDLLQKSGDSLLTVP